MKNFTGKIAAVTGGGSGIGRELCLQLAQQGAAVAALDIFADSLDETRRLCAEIAPESKVTIHECDVSSEEDILRVKDDVVRDHGPTINLLINNAAIGGGGSFVQEGKRDAWERTFNIAWYGVYFSCRAFLPLLVASDEGQIVNVSSGNGFWATLGPGLPQTAYSAAKFAVKGFSEALITDLRLHAPHVKVSVAMPGGVGTSILTNSRKILGVRGADERDDALLDAPTTAAQAATIMLDGIKADKWRILVGEDAVCLDARVRHDPETAYDISYAQAVSEGNKLLS